jgi:hypothetical protein
MHITDPLLYRGGSFLFTGESHKQAIEQVDKFNTTEEPLKRLVMQRDLWAAFDYSAWVPDEWVLKSKNEPGAIALRNRLAKVIGRLTLSDRELAALPDNYALALKSKQYSPTYDREHPERPFLPADLFDPTGPWVRFHETTYVPMAREHFDGCGGRAAHVIFLRLPDGRAATERYLNELRCLEPLLEDSHRHTVKQFPEGTMVAMVRRAFAVDAAAKIRVTPIAELVQIRVYRRIPQNPGANYKGDYGEQDVYEFVLDRPELFAGKSGLRAVSSQEPAEPLFGRREGDDPFERNKRQCAPDTTQLKTCIECHQAPGVYSVLSMARAFRDNPKSNGELFRTYSWDVEMSYTTSAKTGQYNWGLLQGKLEAK